MSQQMPGQHQANLQNQSFQQPQNGAQQRQGPGGPQKPVQGLQQSPQSSSKYEPPKLAFFTLEKPRHVEGWDDVRPERQHIAMQDLQNELAKFRRNQGSVKRALDEISSPSARRLINDLVKEETQKLSEHTRSLQYTIAAIMNVSRVIDDGRKRRQELKRVQVILETEPSGFPDVQSMKPATGGIGGGMSNAPGGQDPNKGMKPNGMGNQGQNMAPQPRPNPPLGNSMGQSQQFERPQGGPPGGGQMNNGGNGPLPPPPPPFGPHQHNGHLPPPPPPASQPPPPPPPGMHHPHPNTMQGGIPGVMPMPVRSHGPPPVQVLDPYTMHSGKTMRPGRHDESSSDSSDSKDWTSDSGSLGSDSIRVRNVEHGTYGLVGKRNGRERTRHSKGSKKTRQHRTRSRGFSRSRSQSRAPHHSSHRRKNSDSIEPTGRHSGRSSGASSPKLPPIHIHMGNNSGDERGHGGHRKRRERRDSHHELPKANRKYESKPTSYSMAREDSQDSKGSWQSLKHGSESSFGTSSVNTGESSIFDTVRRSRDRHSPSYSRRHHGTFTPPRTSGYDDFNHRDHIRGRRADDYPYGNSPPQERDTYYKEPILSSRPLPHRRATEQPYSYAADMRPDDLYPLARKYRYLPDSSPDRNRFKMEDLAGALYEHMSKKDGQRVPFRRHHSARMDAGPIHEDEWYQSSRGRAHGGGYGRY